MKWSAQGLAVVQAAALWALHQALAAESWPATSPGALAACYLVAVCVPPMLLVLWTHRTQKTLWIAAAGMAAFLVATGYQAYAELPGPFNTANLDDGAVLRYALPLIVGWLLFLPLLRGRLESGSWRAPYGVLFRGSWRSYLALAEAVLFVGVFWLLLFLWAMLFQTLDNRFFLELFTDPRFVYPATTLAFASATQIIGTSDRLVDGVLNQLLDLLKWLLPLAGVIVLAFTVALLPRLPALLGSGEKVINSAVMLALVALTILLVNAAYRDGESPPGYGAILQQVLRIVPVVLTLVAATALYSMVVRTNALGLTPARYWGVVTAVFAFLYTAGYAFAAVRSGPWLGAIRDVNFGLATLLLATLAASLTPPGDPLRWSVRSQTQRAVAADTVEVRDSALKFLRFDSGAAGRSALQALAAGRLPDRSTAADTTLAVPPALRVAAARMLERESAEPPPQPDPAATPARYAEWRKSLRTQPQGRPIPPDLESALRSEFAASVSTLDPGGDAPAPFLVFADVNADGVEDALLFGGTLRGTPSIVRDYRLFLAEGGSWRLVSEGSLAR
jgi:hypothetical protein